MGIKQLSKVIGENAARAVTEHPLKSYFGRRIAIDASMSIYQFLIAVRTEGGTLTNAAGGQTSHLIGLFYRTLRLLECGIKPVYVFDGAAPTLKAGELAKRSDLRSAAAQGLQEAKERGDATEQDKFERRLVKVTPQHVAECQELLDAMGVPWLQAPGEAEAQCAVLVKLGLAYGVASEDMDTLTFGAPVMLRHVTASEAKKLPIAEYRVADVLRGLDLEMAQFVDLCILLGCDYCDSIKGIGPMRALAMIRQHRSIEAIIDALDADKRPPADWPFREARALFFTPSAIGTADANDASSTVKTSDSLTVTLPSAIDGASSTEGTSSALEDLKKRLEWRSPDQQAVLEVLVNKHGFSDKRVLAGLERIGKANALGTQRRMDDFFKPAPSADGKPAPTSALKSESKENGKHVAKKLKK